MSFGFRATARADLAAASSNLPSAREALGDLGDRLRVLGHEPGRALQVRDGLPVEPDAPQEGPDVQVDDRVAGLEPQSPGEELERLGEIAPIVVGPAEADVRFGGVRVLVEGLLVIVAHAVDVPGIPELRPGGVAAGFVGVAQGPQGQGVIGIEGQGPLVFPDDFGEHVRVVVDRIGVLEADHALVDEKAGVEVARDALVRPLDLVFGDVVADDRGDALGELVLGGAASAAGRRSS